MQGHGPPFGRAVIHSQIMGLALAEALPRPVRSAYGPGERFNDANVSLACPNVLPLGPSMVGRVPLSGRARWPTDGERYSW